MGEASLFDHFSDRAKRAIFIARELASTRGTASVIEPSHVVDALVREDQGEFAARMPNVVRIIGQEELRPVHPFFSAETGSAVLAKLEGILPVKTEPIPLSADMPISPAMERVLTAAVELAKELHNDQVGPLHLLAAVLSQESEPSSEILMQAHVSREAVIAAIPK
jgi:ATP-dependent Clp protease ATP-binding subunit ClpA